MLSQVWNSIAYVLATGFGIGMVPVFPGAVASLAGMSAVWAARQIELPSRYQWLPASVLILAGVPVCGAAESFIGGNDPPAIVYDEIAAFFVVFALVPLTRTTAALGYGLFLLFDLTKPWPVWKLETLAGGWGIVADDLAAAVYAGLLLAVMRSRPIPSAFRSSRSDTRQEEDTVGF